MNASVISAQPGPSSPLEAVASAWHTVVILVVMSALTVVSSRSGNLVGLGSYGKAGSYLTVMAFEWAMVAFIWYGVSRRGVRIADLVGGRWTGPLAILRDLGIAISFLIVSLLVLNLIGHLLKAAPNQAVRNLLPHGPTETVLYLMLAMTAGFCEELIFRGYLQRQFSAWTHSAIGGIVLQGVGFGVAHGYQGWKYVVIIAVFGTLFGLLAQWRRTLSPGMIAHFVQDGVGGLVGAHFMK